MLVPKQQGRSDYWSASNNAEVTAFHLQNPNLVWIGTIHTHPGFTATPSSIDLHQMFEIQRDQQSSIGIIVATERNEAPIYSITDVGMASLARCDNQDFHEHENFRGLYDRALHVSTDTRMKVRIVDQR